MVNKQIKSRGVAPIIVGQYTINNAIKGELCKFWKKHSCLRGKQCRFQYICIAAVTKIQIPKQNTNLVTIIVTQIIILGPEQAAKYVIKNQDKVIGIILDDYQLLAPTKEAINDCRKKRAEWQDLERMLKSNIEQKIEGERIEELIKRKKSPTKLSSKIIQKQLEKKKLQKKLKKYKRKQKLKQQKKNIPQMEIEQEKEIKKQKQNSMPIPFGIHDEKEIKNPNGSILRVSKIGSLTLYKKNENSFTEDSVWDTHSEISNASSRSVFSYRELQKEMQKSTWLNPPKGIDWNTLQPKTQQEMQVEQTNKITAQVINLTPIQTQRKKGSNTYKFKQTMMIFYKK